ncbi:HlyD family secretion protein [Arcobacter roscoffensis]|uniref:HlyD family secretion protein n=1 Tax=Arcobacter roscoffensis TaxID=2961520 RepID=A0ABY5E4F1_9BACT|nr:HlyD family secretion protein [Arcobacter roscoffensis]UTJ05958.1 HlyD family secretion protein [Arcobacter roscoffensis]
MKAVLISMFLIGAVFASEYYAKLQPVQSYKIKSSVSGKVIYANEDIEGKKANNSLIVQIDSNINKIDLEQSRNKLSYINEMINIEQKNYERLSRVSSKPAFEKDSQKLKVVNLKSSKADIIIKIEGLKDTISKKRLIEKSNYISNIAVKKGDYVNPGTLLYEAQDLSKGKLEFFVPISSIDTIKNKKIFLDGKEANIKINKIYSVADSSHISSYKVELIVDKVKTFSRLVKIEFR